MDVLDVIKSDHQKVLDAIDTLEKGAEGSKDDIFNNLKTEIMGHMAAEEGVVYPLLMDDLPGTMLKSIEAHNMARIALKDLDATSKDSDRWVAKLMVFRDLVLSHMKEEEGMVFDVARSSLGQEQLTNLVRPFQDAEGAGAPITSTSTSARASARGSGSGSRTSMGRTS